jgi:outer membrane protein TolC
MLARCIGLALLLAAGPPNSAFAQGAPSPVPLSLQEAVDIALARNPALSIERIRSEAAQTEVVSENGRFDPVLKASFGANHRDNIIASRFYPTGLYVDLERLARFTVESKTKIGSTLTVGFDLRRLESTSNIQTLDPQYSANLVFSFTQPLLRDFGSDANTSRIRVAAGRAATAHHVLVQHVAHLIRDTEEDYWRWAFAREQADLRQRSLETATRLVAQVETLFGAGKVARTSVSGARAALAQRKEDAIVAVSEAATAEDRLKLRLQVDLASTLRATDSITAADASASIASQSGLVIMPASLTATTQAAQIDHAASLESALRRRPELLVLKREVEQREIELRLAGNQIQPRLDLNAQYMRSGMAGLPSVVCVDPTALVCVPAGSDVQESIFADKTSPSDAFNSLFSRSPFDGWSAELRLEVPLQNRTAKAQRAGATLRLTEGQVRLQAARDEIVLEVRNAVRQADAARARIEAAREAVTATDSQFTATRTQFNAGLASSYEVLRVQDELDRARVTELRALMDLNIALSGLRLADMSLLDHYGIEIEGQPAATRSK